MSTPRKLPQDFPIKVKVPSEAKFDLYANMAGAILEPFARIATVTFIWNRWGRQTFGIERKLTFRQAWALNCVVSAVANTSEGAISVSQNVRANRKKRLLEVSAKIISSSLGNSPK